MNETFDIIKNDGSKEQMEIIAKYKKEGKNYIIYKNLDKENPHFYGASYNDSDLEYTKLNTDLTDEEKNFMNDVFSKFKEMKNNE